MPRKNRNARSGKAQNKEKETTKSSNTNSDKKRKKTASSKTSKKSSNSRKKNPDKNSRRKPFLLKKRNKPKNASQEFIGEEYVARIDVNSDGFAFAIPEDNKFPHLYISKEDLGDVLNGDHAMVIVSSSFRENKYSGKILRIIKRAQLSMMATVRKFKGGIILIPCNEKDRRFSFQAENDRDFPDLANNMIVLAEIHSEIKSLKGTATILEEIKEPQAPHNDTLRVLVDASWPRTFTKEALNEADDLANNWQKRWDPKKTKDIRNTPLCTIDGRDAKDFDDAVYCEKKGDHFRLIVAIADVSFFVLNGTKLNEEAFNKSTSAYFPDHVIPMLPEVLSNGVCSLNPNVDRAAMVADMTISKNGKILDYEFYEALIKSHHRFTYEDAQAFIEKEEWIVNELNQPLKDSLTNLVSLYRVMIQARKERGALDLDMPEPYFLMNAEAEVTDIKERVRLDAHKLIEECMLAANQCSAKFIDEHYEEGMYRVHEAPDELKLQKLNSFLEVMGYNLQRKIESIHDFSEITHAFKTDTPEEQSMTQAIQSMILRSMQQARYCEHKLGHFALALEDYTHFTSPIRRYPDLVVHRLIKEKLGLLKSPPRQDSRSLGQMASHSSQQERRAMDMERRLIDIKKCRFMENHLGKEFNARVSGVTEKGIFCQIEGHFVDGMIQSNVLAKKARAQYVEKEMCFRGPGKIKFQMGTLIKIIVARVDLQTERIDFDLVDLIKE